MEAKVFKQSYFNKFDWSILKSGEFATNGENYTFGKGGPGYIGGPGWHISIYGENGKEEIWELPTVISNFIDWTESNGKKEKLREIQQILGIK